MRIIAGEFRGRKLLRPEGLVTRPITDRVKQSLFDILAPEIPGAIVYDLFAGTGSMGLEALSRGATHAHFFESDRSALARLRKNIKALALDDRCDIIAGDVFRWFSQSHAHAPARLVFVDPPYRFLRERSDDLRSLARNFAFHLTAESLVVFRHDASDELALPGLTPTDRREYGGMIIEILRPGTPV